MELKRKDLVFPELSYKIIGACFSAFNKIGGGLREKHYEQACANELHELGIRFKRQVHCPILGRTKKVADQFIDLLVEDKIVMELKVANRFIPDHFAQTAAYLTTLDLELGLLIRFDPSGVTYRRVLNQTIRTFAKANS